MNIDDIVDRQRTAKAEKPKEETCGVRPGVVKLLEGCWKSGMTDKEACTTCGIPESQLVSWLKEYPELRSAKEAFKHTMVAKSKEIITKVLEGYGDSPQKTKEAIAMAKWVAERKSPEEFGNKRSLSVDVTATQVGTIDKGTLLAQLPPEKQRLLLEAAMEEEKEGYVDVHSH